MRSRPIGLPLTDAEQQRLADMEARPEADEALRERVARAIHGTEVEIVGAPVVSLTSSSGPLSLLSAREIADAAIAVIRTPVSQP